LQQTIGCAALDPLDQLLPRPANSCIIHAGATDTTLRQLIQLYNSRVQEIALLMNVCENPHGVQHSPQPPVQQLSDLAYGHWSLIYALGVSPKGARVALQFYWSNAVTGEMYLPDPQKDVCLHVIQQLQLTDEQQEQITWGYAVLQRVVALLVQHHKQVQQQLFSGEVNRADELFSSVHLPAGLQPPSSIDQGQSEQQQLYKQMQLVLQKLMLMEALIACFVIGRLTLKQNCQLMVSSYPLVLGMARIATYVSEIYKQKQERQAAERRRQRLHVHKHAPPLGSGVPNSSES
jgi:hypothetical protein